MCEHHDQIEREDFGNLMANVETYIRERFGDWLAVACLNRKINHFQDTSSFNDQPFPGHVTFNANDDCI